jgi:hypothetical protein
LVQDQLARGVQIEAGAAPKRGVFPKPVYLSMAPNVPNSVFQLGRTLQAKSSI